MNKVPERLKSTICNIEWVKANEARIKSTFPEIWTNIQNIDCLRVGFNMKLLGIDWRSENELHSIITYFEELNLILRDNYLVKRNPHSIFN